MLSRRRAQQLKQNKQKEKEWLKAQSRKDRNSTQAASHYGGASGPGRRKKNIEFQDSVVLLEAAARNDIVEVSRG